MFQEVFGAFLDPLHNSSAAIVLQSSEASLSAVVLPGWHDPALDFYKILVDSDGRLTRREAATSRWISAKGGYGSNIGLWRNSARETSDPADDRIAPLAAPAVPLIAVDPFFQIFSPRGKLNERTTVAGSDGKEQQISAIAFIGGRACQLVGPPVRGAWGADALERIAVALRVPPRLRTRWHRPPRRRHRPGRAHPARGLGLGACNSA